MDLRSLAAVPLAALALTACGSSDASTGDSGAGAERLDVVVGAYPYEFVAQRVGGDAVTVENLTEPGAEPHDVELTARQVAAVGEADLVVRSAGFQPALDEAVAQQEASVLDVLELVETRAGADPHAGEERAEEGHAEDEHADEEQHAEEEHADGTVDPHVWLDPQRLATIADEVADRLADLSPDQADGFRERAQQLRTELEQLDTELAEGLASCERTQVVTSHEAFGYLTERYGLEQVGISGLSPEGEPSPRRLAEVAEIARANGVTTVFFEETVSPRVAEQLAREVGATAEVLSPLETAPGSGDYLTAMRTNLEQLRTALGCS